MKSFAALDPEMSRFLDTVSIGGHARLHAQPHRFRIHLPAHTAP